MTAISTPSILKISYNKNYRKKFYSAKESTPTLTNIPVQIIHQKNVTIIKFNNECNNN